MKVYRIHRRQFLPIDLAQAWDFFWTPHNLEAMTPPFLNFRITCDLPDKTYNGLIITYRIAAVAGIPMTWVTEIKHVVEPYQFVDEQRLGPFRFWNHQHRFREVPGGIEMEDIVHYVMRFGWVGELVHHLFIRRRLTQIFDFRRDFLGRKFASPDRAPPPPAPSGPNSALRPEGSSATHVP
jgi:ligand-binding SRPBCC domain-containing protein